MFERYTEKARRVIFFARYEASQFGSPYIETEHLLLGLLREDKGLLQWIGHSGAMVEPIRQQIEAHAVIRETVSTSVDLPLSNESKRAIAYAAEEAERLAHKHIGTEHLLLGLMREERSFAAVLLAQRGLHLDVLRQRLASGPGGSAGAAATRPLGFSAAGPQALGSMEFIEDETGKRVGIVPIAAVPCIPQVGEVVIMPGEGPGVEWRVIEVAFDFRAYVDATEQKSDDFVGVQLRVRQYRGKQRVSAPDAT